MAKAEARLFNDRVVIGVARANAAGFGSPVSRQLAVALTAEEADAFYAELTAVMRELHSEEEYQDWLASQGKTHAEAMSELTSETL